MKDTLHFIAKAHDIYGYAHFLCDTGGSLCEVVDPENRSDPVLRRLSANVLLVQIRGTKALTDELVTRFEKDPKPMYYPEPLLRDLWAEYLESQGLVESEVDPDAFVSWGFRRLVEYRIPRYEAIAQNWGVTVEAAEIEALESPEDFDALIADAIRRR